MARTASRSMQPFKNQRYTRVQVAKFVVAALSRLEVEWQYTLGLDDLFDLYSFLTEKGVPKEDARFVLPYCFYSNFE